MGKAYLGVQDPPDATALPGSFPAQDTHEHEHKKREIGDESGEDRDSDVQEMMLFTSEANPLRAVRGHT